jgi:NTE family protein
MSRMTLDAQASEPAATQLRQGIALALSGGGYRAMLFHTGVLIRLNELGLLKEVSRISSVSGGSISAAYLGLIWKRLTWKDGVATNLRDIYVEDILNFSRRSIDYACGVVGFVTQGFLVTQLISWLYDRALFHGATLQDLPSDSEGPRFIICAANLTTGSLWRFSRPYMADWRVGRILNPDFSLARAVAASSAFPPALSPMRLNLKRYEVTQWPEPQDHTEIRPPLPAFVRSRAVLTDGGTYDNHGLEPVATWPTLLVSDGGAPHAVKSSGYWNWYTQAKRVLDVEDNQVRALRRRRLIERFQDDRATGLGKGAYWSIGTNPDLYARQGGLACRTEAVTVLALVDTRLADFGDVIRNALVNWGYAICDKSVRGWYRPDLPAATSWPMPDGLDRVVIA